MGDRLKQHWQRNLEIYIVLAVAAVLRALFVYQWQSLPYALAPYLDAKSYDDWAMQIAGGQIFRNDVFYQSPLYPYFLAVIYKLAGHSLLLVSLIQLVLGTLTCGWIAYLTRPYFGRGAALAAGLLAAADRVLIFYTAPVLKETLGMFTLVAFIHFALKFALRLRKRDAVASGILLGLTALLRGNVLVLFPGLALVVLLKFRARAVVPILIAGFSLALSIAPATLHNWLVRGDFVLMNSCGGLSFYMGNSDFATGAVAYPSNMASDIFQEEIDQRRLAEQAMGRPLLPSEQSKYWLQRGWAYAVSHPAREASLLLKKFWYFWSNTEIADNYDSDFVKLELNTVLAWPLVNFGWIAVLGIIGALMTVQSPATQVLSALGLIYFLSALPFTISDRYRLPEIAFLLPCAGAALAGLYELWQRHRLKDALTPVVLALPMVALAFAPAAPDLAVKNSLNWGLQATLYSDAGRDQEAIDAFAKAIQAGPSLVTTGDYTSAANSHERLGHLKEAEGLLLKAAETHPLDGLALFNLGRFRYTHGDPDNALLLYNRALGVMPYLYEPYVGLAILYFQRGERDLALEAAHKGLAIRPDHPQLLAIVQRL